MFVRLTCVQNGLVSHSTVEVHFMGRTTLLAFMDSIHELGLVLGIVEREKRAGISVLFRTKKLEQIYC